MESCFSSVRVYSTITTRPNDYTKINRAECNVKYTLHTVLLTDKTVIKTIDCTSWVFSKARGMSDTKITAYQHIYEAQMLILHTQCLSFNVSKIWPFKSNIRVNQLNIRQTWLTTRDKWIPIIACEMAQWFTASLRYSVVVLDSSTGRIFFFSRTPLKVPNLMGVYNIYLIFFLG